MSLHRIGKQVYGEGLQCFVRRVKYDYEARAGVLDIPKGSATDMIGAIRFFEQIDSEVRSIEVREDGRIDVLYVVDPRSGEWVAMVMGPAELVPDEPRVRPLEDAS